MLQQATNYNRIVFYDGDCVLCSKTVIFLLKKDKKKRLFFAPLGGKTFQAVSIQQPINEASVVFFKEGELFTKSTAVLKIASHLPFPWPLFGLLLLIPAFVRDYFYRLIGKNRYNWFGKTASCFVMYPCHEDQFLD